MDRSKLADVSEIVSSVAIVVTLIYLVVEIRQNTEALHSQTRQTVLAGAQSVLLIQVAQPEVVTSIVKRSPLTPEENVKLNAWLVTIMRNLEFAWQQFRNGVIDESQWNTELTVLQVVLRPHRTRDWWERLGRPVFSAEFAGFVDDQVAEQEPSDEFWSEFIDWANQ